MASRWGSVLTDPRFLFNKERKTMRSQLEIQKFLRGGGTISDLREEPYSLKVNASQDQKRILFKYHMISSDMSERICQEARGLILENGTWDIVSYPFDKFFNYGETQAACIDWNTAVTFEKMDGSCAVLYNWNGEWIMHTLGTVEGEGEVVHDEFLSLEFNNTFSDLFFHAWDRVYGESMLNTLDPDLIYIFELITPYNRIVTSYDGYRVPLLGVRNRVTLEEYKVEHFSDKFDIPRIFSFKETSLDQIMAHMDFLDLDEEGYVVRDDNFNRIKIKKESYVLMHRQKDVVVNRKHGTLKIILRGIDDDFVSSFPHFKEDVEQTKQNLRAFIHELDEIYNELSGDEVDPNDHEARKEFALTLQANYPRPVHGFMFSKLVGNVDDFEDHLENLVEKDKFDHIASAMDVLGY